MSLPTDRPRVFSHITRTRFLHIEDSLNHNKKLRLFVGSFERGQGASSTAYTFLDVDDARVVLNDLSWGRAVDFADFKGGQDSNGRIISRVLKIQSKEDKVWLEVHNGEGEALFGGVIKPHGQPYAE